MDLKLRRHQISISPLVKGSSISIEATSSTFKLPEKSTVATWFPKKKSRNNFHFPLLLGSSNL